MYLKIFRVVWFISVLALLANMMYVYAALPLNVLIMQNGVDQVEVSREVVFYSVLISVALINTMTFVIGLAYKPNVPFRTWFVGLIISINIFFVAAFSFIGIFNSGEHYDFSRMGTVVYGTIILFMGWALSWPVILLVRRMKRVPIKQQA